MAKLPEASETVEAASAPVLVVTVIRTPGMRAPVGSVTWPRRTAVVVAGFAGAARFGDTVWPTSGNVHNVPIAPAKAKNAKPFHLKHMTYRLNPP